MSFNTASRDTDTALESPNPSAIPGAYPTDDMDTSGSQRNKLHKPNDPRGWDTDNTPRSHQFSDSGAESNIGSGARDSTYQAPQLGRDAPASSNDRYDGLAGAPTSGVGESDRFQRQQAQPTGVTDRDSPVGEGRDSAYTTTKTGAIVGPGSTLPKSGDEENKTTSEDPYWGDLPRGGGVYNTVIGHGSNEDDQARHDPHRQSENLGATSTRGADNSYDSNRQREFPLTGQSQTGYGQGIDDNNRQQTRNVDDQKDDNRRKGLYEAAGAATVASAAYPIARDREQEKSDKHAETAREKEQPKEQKESKLHALFHRDSSGKDEKPAKAEKPKEKKEHVRHEKQAETVAPVAARYTREEQPKSQDYSRNTEPSQFRDNRPSNVDSRDSKAKEALGLGAAGAAAYGATRYAEKEHNKPESGSAPITNKSTDYSQSGNLSAQSHGMTNDYGNRSAGDGKYNTLPSGTPSGVKQENIGDNDTTRTSSSRAEPYSNTKARDGLAATAASAAIVGSQYDKSSYSSSPAAQTRENEPVGRSDQQYTSRSIIDTREAKPVDRTQQEYKSMPTDRYEQQQYQNKPQQEYKSTPAGYEQQQYQSKPVERAEPQYESSKFGEAPKESRNTEAAALGAGAASGAAALAYKSHASPSERAQTTQHSTTTPTHKKPGLSSEDDQYNHLASGTPSGINVHHE